MELTLTRTGPTESVEMFIRSSKEAIVVGNEKNRICGCVALAG